MSKAADVVPLCHHLDSLVDELRRRIPEALESFDEEGIHQARVTTRRLKAAIGLLESALDPDHAKPFAKLGKKLRRRLGPLRDIDVMLEHLAEIKPTSPHAPAAEWLRERLLRDRLHAREKSNRKGPSPQVLSRLGTWWALRQDVIDAHDKVPELLTKSLRLQLDAFIEHADGIVNKPVPSGPGPSDRTERATRDPHELRIAGKNLRYTLELARAQDHDLPKSVLATFKRMQKFLGLWHDYVVLAERAMRASLDEQLALHDPGVQRKVLKLIDYTMARAQKQLDGFAKLWIAQGSTLAQTVREEFALPQTTSGELHIQPTEPPAATTEPQTDPGPAGSPPPTDPAGDSSAPAPDA